MKIKKTNKNKIIYNLQKFLINDLNMEIQYTYILSKDSIEY